MADRDRRDLLNRALVTFLNGYLYVVVLSAGGPSGKANEQVVGVPGRRLGRELSALKF